MIKSIDRPKLINDLHAIETDALTGEEATQFIRQLTNGAILQLSDDSIAYLLQAVDHLLPYYLQLMLEELDVLAMKQQKPAVDNRDIDIAFENVLAKNKNFEDWLERLRAYHPVHFRFINQPMQTMKRSGKIF